MPKKFRDLKLSPFAHSEQREVFEDFSSLLGQCNVDDDRCWTCFAWKVTWNTERQRSGRTYLDRDELILMLDQAVQWLRAHGYWWPMIAVVVKSSPRPAKHRGGRWHVHLVEIADRLPSRDQRELIREALRRASFSDVRLDDLTLSSSGLAWWKPRKEAKADGHEGYRRYAAKNAAEHDSETPFAVYRTSNVPGPALPGEDVTREILRAARSSAPTADAPGHWRAVARAPVQPAPVDHQAAQTAQEATSGSSLPSPLFDPPASAREPQPPAPQVAAKSTAWKDLRPKEVRQSFADMLLRSVEVRPRTFIDRYGDPGGRNQWLHVFEGARWPPVPVGII